MLAFNIAADGDSELIAKEMSVAMLDFEDVKVQIYTRVSGSYAAHLRLYMGVTIQWKMSVSWCVL